MKLHFAPLQGYTEAPYRDAHSASFGGVDSYYAPFVRLDKGEFRNRERRDIEPENNHVAHLVPQLIASDTMKAETILALFIEKGYQEVNINLGCPFPILAKRHNGSGMLPYPEEVKALLEVVNRHPEIHFSVKMRLGWEQPEECLALAPILNELPLQHITLHPRLGRQQYKGSVDRESFAAFCQVCTKPIIYNGDILTVEDIRQVTEQFPTLAGIMIGRGLLANPALGLEYKEERTLSSDELREKIRTMHTAVYSRYEQQLQGGDDQLLQKIKPFWEYLAPQIDRKIWKAIHKSTSLNKYQAAVRLV